MSCKRHKPGVKGIGAGSSDLPVLLPPLYVYHLEAGGIRNSLPRSPGQSAEYGGTQ